MLRPGGSCESTAAEASGVAPSIVTLTVLLLCALNTVPDHDAPLLIPFRPMRLRTAPAAPAPANCEPRRRRRPHAARAPPPTPSAAAAAAGGGTVRHICMKLGGEEDERRVFIP